MFNRYVRPKVEADPDDLIERLYEIPPAGGIVTLPNGAMLQRPNPDMVKALRAIDPRIHYFPTDLPKAAQADKRSAYYRGVTDLLPARIMKDFPGNPRRTSHRGTVVSLRDEFPHFPVETGYAEPEGGKHRFKPIYGPELAPMNSVLTILHTGTDRGGELGKRGIVNSQGKLNTHANDYLMYHTENALEQLVAEGEWGKADNLFPGLLVYDESRVRYNPDATIADPSALIAIYITDRQVHDALEVMPANKAAQDLGNIAIRTEL